ncbi:RNA polymerase-associated protein RapA [Paraliobacillus sp. PM-2]|uniref:DEAD/DEAH box helicase n=1 Tax=Paraliobacillus sp. PM-2 TaxID=1462524 RepID=UPI00061CDA66|nr:DEAD/DEAH box helicase [Paraliobacillus sp. PM-2]CQR46608.1 RNA polymerase-associated protein RapA [Paraliobacillus sp. PM-2]
MALFKRNTVNIILNKNIESKGVIFSIQQDEKPLSLPIRLTVSEMKGLTNLDQLQLVEDLWLDEKIQEVEKYSYFLSYEMLYKLESEERAILTLPEQTTAVDIKIENESFVGSKNFKFIPRIHTEGYPNLHRVGTRKGAIFELPTKENILIEPEYYSLLENIANAPDPRDRDELFLYIAKIKKQAKALGVRVSEHIEREEYEFIDEVSIDLERSHNSITFSSSYKHDELAEEDLTELNKTRSGYTKLGTTRVFVDQNTREKAAKVQQIESIQGQDIPKFVQNPSAFIPEDIDISLEDFGERVKNLGIRVYKAQPFIHANKSENGWFEYETGYQVRDDQGNSISKELDDFFSEDNSGDFKQLDEDTFVAAPAHAEDFNHLATKIKEEAKQNPSSQVIPSNYILEIFENINNIEFNQPIQEVRETLNDEQVLNNQPPQGFTATLKSFQQDGFVWMKSLRFTGYGGLLADDMGLGKTIQVIAYLSYLKEMSRLTPTLLVLPKSLIDNWIKEMDKFAPMLSGNVYVHLGSNRIKDPTIISKFDIVLTTYQTLIRDQLVMGRVDWQMVICDEAQAIKNPSTGASVVVKALKNRGRIALTGTPVENNLTELWSIVDFVQPGILGSLKEFRNSYEPRLTDESAYDSIQQDIESKIHFIYKRRTKAGELKDQLPSKTEYKFPVPMGKQQKAVYKNILKQVEDKDMPPIQGIMRLKMLSSHPGLVDSSYKGTNIKNVPKLVKTLELLNDIKNKGEKAIIFTEYREMQVILKQAILNKFDLNPAIINGTTDRRQHVVDQFNQKDGFDILILAPKAAGTGLTITSANHVIHYTRWWNPAVENQATDRVYRIGQEKDVHVYYPIVTSDEGGTSVEEVVDKLLSKKKELAENVIVPSKDIDIEKEVLGQVVN